VKPAAERVQEAIVAAGLSGRVLTLPASARTAAEAAHALGVTVARIAKSLVFVAGDRPVLVVASGANRVDEGKLEALLGPPVRRADARTVREATGYAIGGVPPLGHATALQVVIDRDLMAHPLIYAAGGAPECVFSLTPDELVRVTAGRVEDVRQEARGQEDAP
jgi:prolyl-tRNA editing enzyme YbaK/EbsC (Cys-tRNA(Pro) deacylase)